MNTQTKKVKERYTRTLKAYTQAQADLEEALRAMHSIGEYPPPPRRLRFALDDERNGATHEMEIGAGEDRIEGYITSGIYSDGTLGEIFIRAEKQGSFVSGLMDGFAVVFSIALQSGIPLERFISKFRHTQFEPAGFTQHSHIRSAKSVLDYLMQWLELRYILTKGNKDGRHGQVDTN